MDTPGIQQIYLATTPLEVCELQQQPQQFHAIPPPGLHPALYLYAQYTTGNPAISYSEYVQRNNT